MARSTKGHSNKDADRPPPDRSKEIGEAPMDDDEVVVDGFQRLSVLGLEVMTLDGTGRGRSERRSRLGPIATGERWRWQPSAAPAPS